MTTAAIADKRKPFSLIFTPLFALLVVYALWGGPDAWQRMLLSLALFLASSATLTGYDFKNRNWLDDGVVGFYGGLTGVLWGSVLSWESTNRFWDKSYLLLLLVLILAVLSAGITAFRTPRGRPSRLVNAKASFASIAALLGLGALAAYFRPEGSIAQIGAVIILIGFFAQPFAPSKPLPLIPFLTLKRLSFSITLLVLLADWAFR